jgi:putative endonuclease
VSSRRLLGQTGEAVVAAWYEAEGYDVLARNWRCREGEIDLIAANGRTLVFCEVKARSSDAFGTPAEAVTPAKQARIRRLAARWLSEATVRRAVIRFDVAGVRDGSVDVCEGAF